jgi:peptidoglycan/LPS O-acetylase OafA/YrhL
MRGDQAGVHDRLRAFPTALPGLTSIRFFLALGVVVFHYHNQWPWNDFAVTGLFERARLGVDAFFILSGFILAHVYDRELVEGRFKYGRFIAARVARIFPLHLAGVAFMVALVLAARIVGAEFDDRGYTLDGLFRTMLLVQSWLPAPERVQWNWNGPSWSLSAEWFAYLLFPFFAWIGMRWRTRPWLLLTLSALVFFGFDAVYRDLFGRILPHAEESLGIMRITPEFLYGVALYRLGQRLEVGRLAAISVSALVGILLLTSMHLKVDDRLIVPIQGALILSLALLSKAGADRWLAARPLTFLGEASFALYLFHMPLLLLWKNVFGELTGRSSDYVMQPLELAGLFALTLAVACAGHVLLEVPARNFIRRWIDRRPVSAASPTPSLT